MYNFVMEITEYVANVVKPMLKHPDYFRSVKTTDSLGVLVTLDLHKEDMGMVIGKKGETAKCLRHIVRVVGMVDGARVSIKINEPHKSG